MIKVFGIGNILLCDDAIGVKVLEKLLPSIKMLSPHIDGIIGEMDYLYCLDCIDTSDFVIIIDSTYLNITPGTVSYIPFSDCECFITHSQSSHEITLLKTLRLEYPYIDGCLIGIEIDKIDFSLELSPVLQNHFESICKEILEFLKKVVKTYA
ncbi:hydrogenase maturation protease [Cellulosilyticum sp. I15G10I2]|uniref:hydrogenase maturation protease n=1 Tax=Cellulosilyticum sp. I15G10I2 TaxID=1892843 RepID=UPI00085C7124|nr:hydrogenase maturation protease [Cellulosilyticum sp. I15G10I2]